MSGVVEFLLARLSETEADALKAASAESADWWVDGPAEHSGKHWVYATGEKFTERSVAEHIARHDPARVLADVAAKRRIVESMGDDWVVRTLATAYSSHPDYDKAWRP